MTFEQILEILQSGKTNYQIAADLHALLGQQTVTQTQKTAVKSRKPRGPNKPKPQVFTLTNGTEQSQDIN